LLLNKVQNRVWEVLVRPGRKVHPGTRLIFQPGEFEGEILENSSSAVRKLRLEYTGDFWDWIKRLGQIPLPPYIRRPPIQEDYKRYQTVFARVPGSVAAPTAGLHFTTDLLDKLPHCEITLHIGYGTFKPIKSTTIQGHQMDKEYYEVGQEVASLIQNCSRSSGKLIAVGTSTTRALEQVFVKHQRVIPDSGWANLFIYPGFDFRVLGGLITNFHLPGSTLLFLVSAFAGKDLIQRCYREAVQRKYRFYSYGDAMLIL
jgi:S-adenosylmethionine:tRNA ribosyltransferase-isomerase